MKNLFLFFFIYAANLSNARTFAGEINIGGHFSIGSSLLMGTSAKKEEITTTISKTNFRRVLHPNINYGFTFQLFSNPQKKVQGYLQSDLFLQNHWLENKWGAYNSNGEVIYIKTTYYRMFEGGFGLSGGLIAKHFKLGIGLDQIFTISNYSKSNLYYSNSNYTLSFSDKRHVQEATWFYKIDLSFKLGYQFSVKNKILFEPYFAYSVGIFHQYDVPINYWGVSKAGRIDNFKVGVLISKKIKLK